MSITVPKSSTDTYVMETSTKKRRRKLKRSYTDAELEEVAARIYTGELSQRAAAKLHKIPVSVLKNHVREIKDVSKNCCEQETSHEERNLNLKTQPLSCPVEADVLTQSVQTQHVFTQPNSKRKLAAVTTTHLSETKKQKQCDRLVEDDQFEEAKVKSGVYKEPLSTWNVHMDDISPTFMQHQQKIENIPDIETNTEESGSRVEVEAASLTQPDVERINKTVEKIVIKMTKSSRKGKRMIRGYTIAHLKEAVSKVKAGEISLRKAGKLYNIPSSTLFEYVQGKYKKYEPREGRGPREGRPQLMTEEQEKDFVIELQYLAEQGYRLNSIQVRQMAAEFAKNCGITAMNLEIAGKKWFDNFKKRHNLDIQAVKPGCIKKTNKKTQANKRPRPMKKHLLIGCTGSVASIKIPILVKALRDLEEVEIRVVSTQNALHFFNKDELGVDVLLDQDEWMGWKSVADPVLHIELRRWADLFLICPLDANTLAKIANGLCDNLLTCVVRAWDLSRPLLFAPAMNTHMWEHPLTGRHVSSLRELGYTGIPCISKKLACGDTGYGAMAEVPTIVAAVRHALMAHNIKTNFNVPQCVSIQEVTQTSTADATHFLKQESAAEDDSFDSSGELDDNVPVASRSMDTLSDNLYAVCLQEGEENISPGVNKYEM